MLEINQVASKSTPHSSRHVINTTSFLLQEDFFPESKEKDSRAALPLGNKAALLPLHPGAASSVPPPSLTCMAGRVCKVCLVRQLGPCRGGEAQRGASASRASHSYKLKAFPRQAKSGDATAGSRLGDQAPCLLEVALG